jgi:hypothetical protein
MVLGAGVAVKRYQITSCVHSNMVLRAGKLGKHGASFLWFWVLDLRSWDLGQIAKTQDLSAKTAEKTGRFPAFSLLFPGFHPSLRGDRRTAAFIA